MFYQLRPFPSASLMHVQELGLKELKNGGRALPVRCRSREYFQAVKHQPQGFYKGQEAIQQCCLARGLGSCCHSSPDSLPCSSTGLVPCKNLWQLACCLGRACALAVLRSLVCPGQESAADVRTASAVADTLADSSPSVFHSI